MSMIFFLFSHVFKPAKPWKKLPRSEVDGGPAFDPGPGGHGNAPGEAVFELGEEGGLAVSGSPWGVPRPAPAQSPCLNE